MTFPKELEDFKGIHKVNLKNPNSFIYFLYDKKELVYIGTTTKLPQTRIKKHIANKVFTNAYYMKLFLEENAMERENELILKFKPKYNLIGIENQRWKKKSKHPKTGKALNYDPKDLLI